VWATIIRPMLRHNGRFRRMISEGILDAPVRTPTGIILPQRRAIRFAWARLHRVILRIVRGLLWHHYGRVPVPDAELALFPGPNFPEEVVEILNSFTNASWIGDTIFRYRHALAGDGPDGSIWALQFYSQTQFVVTVLPRGDSLPHQAEDSIPQSSEDSTPIT
jgi:hypothetical protein